MLKKERKISLMNYVLRRLLGLVWEKQGKERDTIREKRGREASNLQGSFTDSACLGQLAPCVPGICSGFSIDPQALSARISFNTKPTKVNPEFWNPSLLQQQHQRPQDEVSFPHPAPTQTLLPTSTTALSSTAALSHTKLFPSKLIKTKQN